MKPCSEVISALTRCSWPPRAFAQFDHSHKAFGRLSKKRRGLASATATPAGKPAPAGFRRPCGAQAYLDRVVGRARGDPDLLEQEPAARVPDQRLQRHTIELILTKYPNLPAIRDLRHRFTKPWSLSSSAVRRGHDARQHRARHDPRRRRVQRSAHPCRRGVRLDRLCPMLRNEAFTAEKVDAQLEDGMQRFLSDKSRNRYDPRSTRQLRGQQDLRLVQEDFTKGSQRAAQRRSRRRSASTPTA